MKKIVNFVFNVMTGGLWGIARWFFGLFRAKEGKTTFMQKVMVYLVAHSIFSMFTGAISPWAILRGVGYAMAMLLTAGGYDVKPPEDERTKIERIKDAAHDKWDDVTRKLAEQKKAMDDQAIKLKEEAAEKLEAIKRKFEHESSQRELEHKKELLEQEAEKLKIKAEKQAAELSAKAERERKDAQERSDKAIKQAQAAAEEAKRQAKEQMTPAFMLRAVIASAFDDEYHTSIRAVLCPQCGKVQTPGKQYLKDYPKWPCADCKAEYRPLELRELTIGEVKELAGRK